MAFIDGEVVRERDTEAGAEYAVICDMWYHSDVGRVGIDLTVRRVGERRVLGSSRRILSTGRSSTHVFVPFSPAIPPPPLAQGAGCGSRGRTCTCRRESARRLACRRPSSLRLRRNPLLRCSLRRHHRNLPLRRRRRRPRRRRRHRHRIPRTRGRSRDRTASEHLRTPRTLQPSWASSGA